jgi:hypothetical protein
LVVWGEIQQINYSNAVEQSTNAMAVKTQVC